MRFLLIYVLSAQTHTHRQKRHTQKHLTAIIFIRLEWLTFYGFSCEFGVLLVLLMLKKIFSFSALIYVPLHLNGIKFAFCNVITRILSNPHNYHDTFTPKFKKKWKLTARAIATSSVQQKQFYIQVTIHIGTHLHIYTYSLIDKQSMPL